MTPVEKRLWLAIQRRTSSLSPDMSSAIRKAFDTIRLRMADAEILRAIQSGSIDSLFEKALSDATLQQAFQPVRDQMRDMVTGSVQYFARSLPTKKNTAFAFDSLSPDVIQAVGQLESRVITDLQDSVREVVRSRLLRGITDGESAASIGRDLRNVIGLSPTQEQAIQSYEQLLKDGSRQALNRQLRDKRYDKTVLRGELSDEQIGRMTDAYRRRMVNFNADTVARTAVLDSQKLGQQLSYDRAVEQGIITGQLMKTWVGVMDDRERDEHVEMEGETVASDDTYSNGEDIPGESTYNCRCISRFTTQ